MTTTPWQPGQLAVIDRRGPVVTIDRVTRGGRAIVGDLTFDPNGRERGGSSYLEPLTPEIEAQMALVARSRVAGNAAFEAIHAAELLVRKAYRPWLKHGVADLADVEQIERLVAAIRGVLEEKPHG